MGPILRTRLILLTLCLLLVVAAVYGRRPEAEGRKEKVQSLADALAGIDGWRLVRHLPLDPEVVRELQLDDYAFLSYTDGRELVSLYIGYYLTAEKVGAPHHPMVCFSGQGWHLSEVRKEELRLASGAILPCARMTAGRDLEEQFILYWFQAGGEATSGPFRQKLSLARQKFLNGAPESAFVRISLPTGGRPVEECRQVVQGFVDKFYPVFLAYIHGQPT